eukprot:scpid30496/ scgid4312/ MAP kinase-interacting serine/threonine-protein kinase 1; MAP kinase signal-integrating kinase 1
MLTVDSVLCGLYHDDLRSRTTYALLGKALLERRIIHKHPITALVMLLLSCTSYYCTPSSKPVAITARAGDAAPNDYPYCVGQLEDSLDSALSENSFNEHSNTSKKKKKKKRRFNADASNFVNSFYDLYYLTEDILGEGALSSVHTCIEKSSGEEFAVKIVNCVSIDHRRRLLREIEILHLCQHQNHVVHLKEYFEAEDAFFVVFFKAQGGPLLEHIRRRRCFSEDEARAVTLEIAEALVFLHHKGIAHRDLKPANILCERSDQVTPIRICDFDLGSNLSSSKSPTFTPQLGTPVGSCEFMAPEVIAAFANQDLTYDKKCDTWSLGVILYIMLSGRPPFGGGCGAESCAWEMGGNCAECQDILIEAIKNGEVRFPEEDWENVSESAKDLIRGLLTQCPRKRLSSSEVLEHPWMTQQVSTTPLNTTHNLNKHGTQTHAIPRLLMAYSVSNFAPRPIPTLSPMDFTSADNNESSVDALGRLPGARKWGIRDTQSSPPYFYYRHLTEAVQTAFSNPEDVPEPDIFGVPLELQ